MVAPPRLAAIVGLLLLPSGLLAAETLSGRVTATKRDANGVRAATLTTPKGEVYNIEIDERGESFGRVMHGESAEIRGEVAERDGARWVRVLEYTDERVAAGHEYWRRMRCLACVVLPATRNAATPADLHGAAPIAGRWFSLKRKITAWTRDADTLWIAEDNALHQIDLAACRVARTYGKADGLPDQLIYQLLGDGKTLWLVHRAGVAAVKPGDGRVADLPEVRACYAQAAADPAGGAWVVADTGTFRLKSPDAKPAAYAAIPTAARIRKVIENGIWVAHWARRTAHLLAGPVALGGRLYVGSYGDLYELADGKWDRIAEGAWGQAPHAGRLWFLTAKGLAAYDPETRKAESVAPPDNVQGRNSRLLVTGNAAWLLIEPMPGVGGQPAKGGGLARFGFARRAWEGWPELNGLPARNVACLTEQDGAVWAVTMAGDFRTKSAHPGMTTTNRQDFVASGFALHRYAEKEGSWISVPLKLTEVENRLICGQDGKHSPDAIAPQFIEDISVGGTRVFAAARLVPRQFFGGYWPCVEQVASRPNAMAPWAGEFVHAPAQAGLQGEQPLVLNISSGELTRIGSTLKDQLWEAVGHDLILGLLAHAGRHWAVTEGGVACFDEAAARWTHVLPGEFRWYWRATAALDDGRSLVIGSDRGLVCRLDLAAGRFEFLGALKDRAIARIAKAADGALLVAGRQAPLGLLPVQLREGLKPLDADIARFDGKAWTAAKPDDLPPAEPAPLWAFRQFDRKDHLDKSHGNFLCGPGAEAEPRYYVKEAFFPQFLCTSADGGRMWLSTYTGLLRLDLAASATQ